MTREDDPRIARYNQRIVEASTKYMTPTEGHKQGSPGRDLATPVVVGKDERAGIPQEDIDMKCEGSRPVGERECG